MVKRLMHLTIGKHMRLSGVIETQIYENVVSFLILIRVTFGTTFDYAVFSV